MERPNRRYLLPTVLTLVAAGLGIFFAYTARDRGAMSASAVSPDSPDPVLGSPTSSQRTARGLKAGAPPRFLRPAPTVPPPTTERIEGYLGTGALYNDEARNLSWAPKMEVALKARFSPERIARLKLEGMTVPDLECRETTCRIVVEYPKALYELLDSQNLPTQVYNPLSILTFDSGPLASMSQKTSLTASVRDGHAFERLELVLGFGSPEEIDPATYNGWSEKRLSRELAQLERVRQRFPKTLSSASPQGATK